jgi:hypothetical protein
MLGTLRKTFDSHRDERANELFEIATILDRAGLAANTQPIRQAAAQCRSAVKTAGNSEPDAGREYWGYEINDLRIRLEDQRHFRPRSAIMRGVDGILSVKVQEYVPQTVGEIGAGFNLLRQVSTDFYTDVVQVVQGVEEPLRAAWHLDTHLFPNSITHAVHPRFHFQVGGERLDEVDGRIRGVFMPESPRLPVAPLDGVLAVDFVLSHYCGDWWQTLRFLEPQYGRLRVNPLQRYWHPYYRALADGIARLHLVPAGGEAAGLIPSICIS